MRSERAGLSQRSCHEASCLAQVPLTSVARAHPLATSTGKIRGSGPTIEIKLLKELMEQQKKADPSVKDWAKAVTEAMKMVNLLLIHVRDELTKSAKTNYSPATVMSKIKAMLSDFGREAAGVTSGRPSIRFQKDFKLLFQGKNPITNIVFVTPDGKDFDFKAKGSGSVGGTMQYIYNVFFNVQHPNNLCAILRATASRSPSDSPVRS